MYNANQPNADELPSSAQLLKSTLVAIGVASVILVTAVLPAEYGIDPTGAGKALGLTQMGTVNAQLAEEAAADQQAALSPPARPAMPAIVAKARAEPAPAEALRAVAPKPEPRVEQIAAAPVAQEAPRPAPAPMKRDEVTFKLTPGQGAEVKLEMMKGKTVSFHWTGNGGEVNYDTHGDPYDAPRGFYHGYGKGKLTPEDKGQLEAAFDGYHGWFWRNRTKQDLTVTLRVEGDYIALKRVL